MVSTTDGHTESAVSESRGFLYHALYPAEPATCGEIPAVRRGRQAVDAFDMSHTDPGDMRAAVLAGGVSPALGHAAERGPASTPAAVRE
jgi:hypothetical protein